MKTCFVITLLLALAAQSIAQQFGYVIIIQTGPGSSVEGKPKVILSGGGFEHKVKLSPYDQKLNPNMRYQYAIAAPMNIMAIESVAVDWSRKGFGFSKLPVDKVIVDPAYIQDMNMRSQNVRGFCSGKRPENVSPGSPKKFWLRC